MITLNRTYKDRLFRLIFADEKNKANTLSLYNALNNSSYTDESELEITTIEDVIYITMKNDLSFIIADQMNLYEQQSSHNPNMPIRGFLYFGHLYEKYLTTRELSLHVRTLVKIPTPKYIIFYNGLDNRPAVEKLRLSDAFQILDDTSEFEWTATVINLNHADNSALLKRCKPLYDYTSFVSRIQSYQKTMSTTEAVDQAIDECIEQDILAEFLTAHKAEVLGMYLAEFNVETFVKRTKEIEREEGMKEERQKNIQENRQKLKSKIQHKINENKSVEQIADELVEDIAVIQPLYEELMKQG